MHDASLCMMILEKAIQCLGYVGTYIYLSMLLLAFTDKVVFLLKPVFQLAQHVECQALACLSSNLIIHIILREEPPFQSGTNTLQLLRSLAAIRGIARIQAILEEDGDMVGHAVMRLCLF